MPILEIRTCKEHLCRILRRKLLWWQCLSGYLMFDVHFTPRPSGKPDRFGQVAVWHANIYLRRRTVKPGDPRHIALEAYCALTPALKITASGLMDPKNIFVGRKRFAFLSKANPTCDVCEGGDMIPMEERFYSAPYSRPTPPFSPFRKRLSELKTRLNRRRDLIEQGLVLTVNRAKMKP